MLLSSHPVRTSSFGTSCFLVESVVVDYINRDNYSMTNPNTEPAENNRKTFLSGQFKYAEKVTDRESQTRRSCFRCMPWGYILRWDQPSLGPLICFRIHLIIQTTTMYASEKGKRGGAPVQLRSILENDYRQSTRTVTWCERLIRTLLFEAASSNTDSILYR